MAAQDSFIVYVSFLCYAYGVLIALVSVPVLFLLVLVVREERRFRKLAAKIRSTHESLATIAHALRTPLIRMRAENEFFRHQEFGSLQLAQIEALNRMESSVADTIILLNRLLAASRIEYEGMTATPVAVGLVSSLDAALSALDFPLTEKKHVVRFRKPKQDVPVHADPLLLHGVFEAVLSNAIAYTPPKGTITIDVKPVKDWNIVTIQDTGIGIPPQEKPRVFQKFFRGELAKKMKDGSGLGLSFAQRFLENIGGTIRFTSAAKKGSTFTIALPRPATETLKKAARSR